MARKHTISIECFERGEVRVSKEYVNDAGERTVSALCTVTPHTAAHLVEEMATSMAAELRMQAGAGVHRG